METLKQLKNRQRQLDRYEKKPTWRKAFNILKSFGIKDPKK